MCVERRASKNYLLCQASSVERRASNYYLLCRLLNTSLVIDSKLSVGGTDVSVDDDIGVDFGSFRCFRGTYSYYQTLLRRIVELSTASKRRIVEIIYRSSNRRNIYYVDASKRRIIEIIYCVKLEKGGGRISL